MILVTGMHRSGTSLVAMTLESLGVDFGDHGEFYAADQWNASGYYERKDVMDINSRMITGLTRTRSPVAAFFGQIRYLTQPSLDSIDARGRTYRDEISRIGARIGSGAIKDPRLCLTWPSWAESVDIGASVVCLRHPYEVADSLRRRQRIPLRVGMSFWAYHIEALRRRTPPGMVVVDLEGLMSEPSIELGRLIAALDLAVDVEEGLDLFRAKYRPGLTTTTSPDQRPALSDEIEDLWAWLRGLRATTGADRPE
jgi:hypothetical protein